MMEEQRKAVWPTTINGQSLSGSTGTMETQLPSIQVRSMYGVIIARRTILPESVETTQYWTRSVPSHHTTAEGLHHTQS